MMFAFGHAVDPLMSFRARDRKRQACDFRVPLSRISLRHCATFAVCMCSMPAYKSSTFSRTTTRSMLRFDTVRHRSQRAHGPFMFP